jgi:hypothetical protein
MLIRIYCILFIFVSFNLYGDIVDKCQNFGPKFLFSFNKNFIKPPKSSIKRSENPEYYNEEYSSAGKVIERADELSHLEDGTYIYLLDKSGNLIQSVRTPKYNGPTPWILNESGERVMKPGAKYMATHRGLEAELAKKLGVNIDDLGPMGAGEYVVLNGKVNFVSNQSGTYRGGGGHLDYSIEHLRSHGLPVRENTIRTDISQQTQVDSTHFGARRLAQAEVRYQTDAKLQKEVDLVREFYRKLAKKYPDPNNPGHARKIISEEDNEKYFMTDEVFDSKNDELINLVSNQVAITHTFSQLVKESNDIIGPSQSLLQDGRFNAREIIELINGSLERHPDFSKIEGF